MTRTVGIYLFDDVEVLDFAGPFEVFSTATRVKTRLHPDTPPAFNVVTIADSVRAVKARGGLVVQAQFGIAHHPAIDVLIVPGGVVTAELQRQTITDWMARIAYTSTLTASVCTGAFLLARAGLLRGKKATTHWEDIDDLSAMFPDVHVQTAARWVDTGQVITSAGIAAGIDMSLHIVARLEGEALALKTARQMEFDWEPSGA
jgi:transcriptional regulator GlxA family with amidase domain